MGDNIAKNGGNIMSLNDEAVSFFTMHGILNQRGKLCEGREFRQFLSLYGGDGLERQTGMFKFENIIYKPDMI